METYIDRIKHLKNEKRMTNEQLSARAGIPLGTLSKILAGMSESPKLSNIIALCGALDCSVEYIVSGTPENTHNFTLSAEEIGMIEAYRRLDPWGRSLVDTVLAKAGERTEEGVTEALDQPEQSARILRPIVTGNRYAGEQARTGKRSIRLFDLPVSAGVGVFLEEEEKAEQISIPNSDRTAEADYALRISGNSMEPKYHNGDILLVQYAEAVEVGELGIFLLDGCGFFKVYGGDRLLSLNPDYAPIPLSDFASVYCKGRVVGRLKRK